MTDFVISDTHFGHKNIIKLCNRPFKDVEEMDRTLIQNWNQTVTSENDTVWFLGDFSWYKDEEKNESIFNALKGIKFLIKGNHDNKNLLRLRWASRDERYEIVWKRPIVVLDHYPLQDWNHRLHGSIHLHGHVHGNNEYRGLKNRWDVSVENSYMNYTPKELQWFIERAEK